MPAIIDQHSVEADGAKVTSETLLGESSREGEWVYHILAL